MAEERTVHGSALRVKPRGQTVRSVVRRSGIQCACGATHVKP